MTFAWLIEKNDSEVSRPRYYTGRSNPDEWSAPGDHSDACRFSRQIDALKVAGNVQYGAGEDEPHRVCEHGWE